MTSDKPNLYLLRAAESAAREQTFSHPFNPRSEISGAQLAAMTGLKRTGVNLARIPPGKESFVYHSHWAEEEWIYILSGHGRARIDGVEYEVGPGDFMGFPTPGVAHHLANPYDTELVYLMGGERREVEVADFPDLGRRMVRRGSEVDVFDIADARGFGLPET
ncbi:MAG TPA: cupin domain-containing protein [Steroidobacteraceae bacterium]|nr:cupin domain-containing protein [Steroidobacteraceae bacterium]